MSALKAADSALGQTAQFSPTPDADGSATQDFTLAALQREVRRFSFEDRELAPIDMPLNFVRVLTQSGTNTDSAGDVGFPAFGTMEMADDYAVSGNWSFRFSLNGGSMAARLPASVVPVLPGADYEIRVHVRTADLEHARARVVAWFHDERGEIIPASRVESTPIQSERQWLPVSLTLFGEHPQATGVIIELQLLQPAQFATTRGQFEPLLEDVNGHAWFDELVIWQLPRIELTTGEPGNVVINTSPTLTIGVHDLTNQYLTGRLRIFDDCGEVVHQTTFDVPQGAKAKSVQPQLNQFGWYRAVLDITASKRHIARRWIDLAYLPAINTTSARRSAPFGVHLAPTATDDLLDTLPLLRMLDVSQVTIPLWDRTTALADDDHRHRNINQMVDRLLNRDVEVALSLEAVPFDLAQSLRIDRNDVAAMLAADATTIETTLSDVLFELGQKVTRWQIGATTDEPDFALQNLDELHAAAGAGLGRFLMQPTLLWPVGASIEANSAHAGQSFQITVPYHIQPDRVVMNLRPWAAHRDDASITLQTMPVAAVGERAMLKDLMLRSLELWRDGWPRIAIAQPWRNVGNRDITMVPEPSFAVWSQMSQRLGGRRFAGELVLGEGTVCWILESTRSDVDAALVLWNPTAIDEAVDVQALLAAGDVQMIDCFGNRTLISPADGEHRITVTDMPLFVEGVDARLARFRATAGLQPGTVAAEHRRREHVFVLENPWDVPIAGRVQLLGPEDWEFTPRTQAFSINPGARVELPVSIVLSRQTLAGPQTLNARIQLTADREYDVHIQQPVEVGLPYLDMTATWGLARNVDTGELDLVITQLISNTGDEPLELNAMVWAEGYGQLRRIIPRLDPGQTMIRTFRLPDGAAQLANSTVRIGIAQRDGAARMNHDLAIPPLPTNITGSSQAVTQATDDG